MKKRTVITTEKHEVWVIREVEEAVSDGHKEDREPAASDESLSPLPENDPDKHEARLQKNH